MAYEDMNVFVWLKELDSSRVPFQTWFQMIRMRNELPANVSVESAWGPFAPCSVFSSKATNSSTTAGVTSSISALEQRANSGPNWFSFTSHSALVKVSYRFNMPSFPNHSNLQTWKHHESKSIYFPQNQHIIWKEWLEDYFPSTTCNIFIWKKYIYI